MKKLIICASLLLSSSSVLAQSHPDESRYEYAVKASSGNYPPEAERTYWSCYSSVSKFSMACSYARGESIRSFDYVYRNRDGSPPYDRRAQHQAQLQKCGTLHDDALQKKSEALRSRLGADLENACGEVEKAKHSIELGRVALSAYQGFTLECRQIFPTLSNSTSSYLSEIQAAKRKLTRYSRYCEEDRDDRAGRSSRRNAGSTPSPGRRGSTPSEELGIDYGSGRIGCFGCQDNAPNGGPTKPGPGPNQSDISGRTPIGGDPGGSNLGRSAR